MSNFHILFMFYSTNVGIWLVFCKDIWISQQHSKSCHKVHQIWLLMLVQFPYNLFKIISTVMLVIYIKSISVTAQRKEEKTAKLRNWEKKIVRYFISSKYQERSKAGFVPSIVGSVHSQIFCSLREGSKWAHFGEKHSS